MTATGSWAVETGLVVSQFDRQRHPSIRLLSPAFGSAQRTRASIPLHPTCPNEHTLALIRRKISSDLWPITIPNPLLSVRNASWLVPHGGFADCSGQTDDMLKLGFAHYRGPECRPRPPSRRVCCHSRHASDALASTPSIPSSSWHCPKGETSSIATRRTQSRRVKRAIALVVSDLEGANPNMVKSWHRVLHLN